MIQEGKPFNNGLFDCQEIYSDNGKKILETTNGQLWNTDEQHPIVIAVSRRADYVETDEPAVIGSLDISVLKNVMKANDYVKTDEPIKEENNEKTAYI